jgi:hypothetical protein
MGKPPVIVLPKVVRELPSWILDAQYWMLDPG